MRTEKLPLMEKDSSKGKVGRRPIFVDSANKLIESDIYSFEKLKPGNKINGPAVVHTPITTIVIQDRQTGFLDEYRNMIVNLS
mgnify:CR=1 FL=1